MTMASDTASLDTASSTSQAGLLAGLTRQQHKQRTASLTTQYVIPIPPSGAAAWHTSDTVTDASLGDLQKYAQHATFIPAAQSNTDSAVDLQLKVYWEACHAIREDAGFDVDARLVPPPAPERRIKVKLRFIGREVPRIAFDPERD